MVILHYNLKLLMNKATLDASVSILWPYVYNVADVD